jgi:molybdenum cofactor cytidylyltransferase
VISGVILAAGSSKRLGRPKQLLLWRGRPLLQHVVDAAAASKLSELVVVLGHEAELISKALSLPEGARVVCNMEHESGQASSLKAGLAALSAEVEAAAIMLSDHPYLSAELIDSVLAEFDPTATPVVRPRFGAVPGHPVVVARGHWEHWSELIGDEGARSLLNPSSVRELSFDENRWADVDTWSDYHALLERG